MLSENSKKAQNQPSIAKATLTRRTMVKRLGLVTAMGAVAMSVSPTLALAGDNQTNNLAANFKPSSFNILPINSDTAIRPFRVGIRPKALADLRRRLEATRWPSKELVADTSQGVQLATIQALTSYWATKHDWRKTEARLNALPQFTTEIDGLTIHFIHVKSRHANALPLIITHGWPGSIIEMLGVIGPLTDPTAHGGQAEDAFDVVIPSMPGYGFSEIPTELGWHSGRIAAAWAELMNRLGYTRYVAQGGDQGAGVTDRMGRLAPAGLLGIHLNLQVAFPPQVIAVVLGLAPIPSGISNEERAAYLALMGLSKRGYLAEMNEHPQTIGYPQADSPSSLAAWMLDHDPDSYRKISQAFLGGPTTGGLTRENILDNMALYWLTNTGVSSARLYWEGARAQQASAGMPPLPMLLPAAFSVFPDEIYRAQRSWAEKAYPNLIYFNEAARGGHFAAWEEPELFAAELRAAFKSLR